VQCCHTAPGVPSQGHEPKGSPVAAGDPLHSPGSPAAGPWAGRASWRPACGSVAWAPGWPSRPPRATGAGPALARFSLAHQITGSAAWVAALVMMALADVLTRRVVIYLRGRPPRPAASMTGRLAAAPRWQGTGHPGECPVEDRSPRPSPRFSCGEPTWGDVVSDEWSGKVSGEEGLNGTPARAVTHLATRSATLDVGQVSWAAWAGLRNHRQGVLQAVLQRVFADDRAELGYGRIGTGDPVRPAAGGGPSGVLGRRGRGQLCCHRDSWPRGGWVYGQARAPAGTAVAGAAGPAASRRPRR